MLALNVRVAAARDRTGVATLRDGSKTVMTGPVVASATQAIAARRSNPACDPLRVWGHPPFGRYRLLHSVEARPDLHGEYGTHLLLFEPESGQALEAESFGRLALLAYGGPAGRDGRMRRTQGGLRLSNKMLYAIVERLRADADMVLALAPLAASAWWQFWKRPEETMPLSGAAPEFLSPPADEASVVEELLTNPALVRRRRRTPEREDSRDWDDDRDDRRDRSSSGSGSGSGRETFQGKGGESAGAGASGGWDSAPGRGPGVDQAGRIVAGAAAAAGLAAIVSEAAGGRSGQDDPTGAGDSGAGSGSEGSSSVDLDSSTTTSTSY
jgi:uncharacterized membrane protein YgcG